MRDCQQYLDNSGKRESRREHQRPLGSRRARLRGRQGIPALAKYGTMKLGQINRAFHLATADKGFALDRATRPAAHVRTTHSGRCPRRIYLNHLQRLQPGEHLVHNGPGEYAARNRRHGATFPYNGQWARAIVASTSRARASAGRPDQYKPRRSPVACD